jgi:hypothetical protein
VPAVLALAPATAGYAQAAAPKFTARQVTPTSTVSAAKSVTSRLAQTDPSLLNRTDSAPVSVLIKLNYDPLATYRGDIVGYGATSPQVTGKKLSNSPNEQRYNNYIAGRENSFMAALKMKVPTAKGGLTLRTVYGGVAATVPANRIKDVLALPGVVAVQADSLRKPLTDSSPDFIGATSLYPDLGGAADAGKGVIFGSLDTGVWPEHPEFADNGNLSAPPPKADATPRTCNFGDNPLTPANDPFVCNNKLIGGQPFLATYIAALGHTETYETARDSDGHGTHTASTAAGDPVDHADVLGVDRGPLHGIAPGAWVSVYKVCGAQGCFSSDSAAAVQQAIKDGVNVINFSISGGTDPTTDPVELAFLDAYAAGVFVAASAGNDGPTASTANHLSPWVTTVAASTQKREFDSTLTLNATGGATAQFTGASITAGVGPLPVVMSSAAPYSAPLCDKPATAGMFTGKIVACQRGTNARVEKGFNVLQGGAAGMILYNPSLADVETDNHWLPAIHLANGTSFVAFMGSHTGVTGSFTQGAKVMGPGDVMASFSSRGPAGNFIKPDVTAPGIQILAGNTPTPDDPTLGPPGQYYQAIAGTSMSSPHVAGSGILLKALHPDWTPGQIKSALMTTANENVVKEDTVTHADPFDDGSGRIALGGAGNPGLTFDDTAAHMASLTADPVHAVDLNIPSIDAPTMPGKLTTVRTAMNVTNTTQSYHVQTTAPAGSKITVTPSAFSVGAGKSVKLTITITSSAATGQYFGEVRLVPSSVSLPTLHLPVAFVPKQGSVNLTSNCAPTSIKWLGTTNCTVTAQNNSFTPTTVDLSSQSSLNAPIVAASGGATQTGLFNVHKNGVSLSASQPGVPNIGPGSLFGYIPLDSIPGITPFAIGDEQFLNFTSSAPFLYNGESYTGIGVNSNGYIVVGGGTAQDDNCCNLTQIPDAAPPNNVLAPYWTDLNGAGAPGIFAAELFDGPNVWFVVEWRVNVFGTNNLKVFQVWIGENGTQDITFAYDPGNLPGNPGQPFLVGAENKPGTGGHQLPTNTPPTQDLRVTSTNPIPGGSTSYTLTLLGLLPGNATLTSSMSSPLVPGTTVVTTKVTVKH